MKNKDEVSLYELALENAEEFLEEGDVENNSLRKRHVNAILKYGLEEKRISVRSISERCQEVVRKLLRCDENPDACYVILSSDEIRS